MKLEKEIAILDFIEDYFSSFSKFFIERNNENELIIAGNTADIYISISAGGYLSVMIDQPFMENDYYAFSIPVTRETLNFIYDELEK